MATSNPAQLHFADSDAGMALNYPADWKPVSGSNSQLKVAAPTGGQLTLDVPALPFHLAGMIPIDQVESGYVNDVKKRMPDAAVTPLPDPTLPNSKQRRVKLAGHMNGKSTVDEAALIVHGDNVYVLSIDADETGYPQMHTAMDAVLKSWQWTK